MKRTILSVSDFDKQAAAILAASKAKRGDFLRMEDVGGDDNDGAPGSDDDADDADDADDSDDDTGQSDGDDGKDDKDAGKKDDADDKVDRAEYERVKRHRAAADRKVADLTTQVDTLKRENAALKADGKTTDGKDSSERETQLQSEVSKRDQTIHELRIQNAFLAANDYSWYDAADALRLADLRDVEIEEDGTVVGLKEALQKLAKDKPHLLKKADSTEPPKGKSGSSTNGKRKGGSTKPDRAALSRTYPVLATRR